MCFCVWFCLYSFAFTICLRVLSVHFLVFFYLKIFFSLIIIFFLLFILINLFYFILLYFSVLFYLISFILSIFSPFYAEPCGWKALGAQARCQGRVSEVGEPTGPQETSQIHIISNGENLPEISISTTRPSFTQWQASYSAGHPMPNN